MVLKIMRWVFEALPYIGSWRLVIAAVINLLALPLFQKSVRFHCTILGIKRLHLYQYLMFDVYHEVAPKDHWASISVNHVEFCTSNGENSSDFTHNMQALA